MNYKLTIGWLYPDLMSTYGDRGNIIVLQKRCQWREVLFEVKRIGIYDNPSEIKKCDFIFMGGAQDKQQEIVNHDLLNNKGKYLIERIEMGIPGLFICGAYQFMGKYYKTSEGTIIKGLSLYDLYTQSPSENEKRLIGNIIIKIQDSGFRIQNYTVGFENHGGRTFLGKNMKPFGNVVFGYGNNGGDQTEGVIYKNSIGTYLHGPILPKNPELADQIIKVALQIKYKENINLSPLEDALEQEANKVIVKRYLS